MLHSYYVFSKSLTGHTKIKPPSTAQVITCWRPGRKGCALSPFLFLSRVHVLWFGLFPCGALARCPAARSTPRPWHCRIPRPRRLLRYPGEEEGTHLRRKSRSVIWLEETQLYFYTTHECSAFPPQNYRLTYEDSYWAIVFNFLQRKIEMTAQ